MKDIISAGGWLMLPILACSVLALAIGLERLFSLRTRRVLPAGLFESTQAGLRGGILGAAGLVELAVSSPLGSVFAAGLRNAQLGREAMRDAMEQAARQVAHELERYLTTLGVIASAAPLLGLLGTVIGMIRVFATLVADGAGNPSALAGGIGQALITTAGGLMVAIPALIGHRLLGRRVDALLLAMERESARLLDLIAGPVISADPITGARRS